MTKQVLQQALEAMEEIHHGNMTPMAEGNWNKAIEALRSALAQQGEQHIDALIRDIEQLRAQNASLLATLDQEAKARENVSAMRSALAQQGEQQPVQSTLFDCDIQPRPLAHQLRDYHLAPSEGPLNYTWQDKPHRLLYDLIAAVKYYAAAPAAQPELTTCNCRWDGETQVQQCTLHEAHVDAIHEWAERAKTAEKALAQQGEQQPVAIRYKLRGDLKWQYTEDRNQPTPPCTIQDLYTRPAPAAKPDARKVIEELLYCVEAWERGCLHEDYWRDRDDAIQAGQEWLEENK